MVGRPGKYQPRFTNGEIDPLLSGNTDEAAYLKGASLMQNVRPLPQGGFSNVWGTKVLGSVPLADAGGLSSVRIVSFTHSRDAAYDLVLSDQTIDVYGESGYLARFSIPHVSDQIPMVKSLQQLDTMVLLHNDVQPRRILRNSDASWTLDLAPFINIPNYDYGAAYTNGVAAVWAISFFNTSIGNHYLINVNGVDSAVATYANVPATENLNIFALLLAMPGIASGFTVTNGPGTTPGGTTIPASYFGIEFTGAGNEGDGWAVSGRVVDNGNAAVTSSHLRVGVLGGEPIMSPSRGWPGSGAIFGQRFVIGGFKSLPNAFLASQVGNYWNLDTRLTLASAPMLVPIDTDGAEQILDIHRGRTLEFFTSGGEYWLNDTALDRTKTPPVVLSTTNGVAPTVPVEVNEAATIYVDRSGGAFWEYQFDYTVQNYYSNNMSVRSSKLAEGLIDMTMRRLSTGTETNELWAVREDGLGVVISLLRREEITAFWRRVTDGKWRAVNANDRREVTLVSQRIVNGVEKQFVERMVEGVLLDQAIDFNLGAPGKIVTGLEDLEGATVWAMADGFAQGPFVVAGGRITLGFAATSGYVGRWTPPRVLTMPQPRDIAPRTVMRRPCRVHTVRLRVVDTTSIAIGANGSIPVDVPIPRFDQSPADTPIAPFTGELVCEGIQGFSNDGIVEITQLRPGLMTVVGVTTEVDL